MFDSLMDALGYVGDALDKPGRAVRGMLAGNFGEGLAAVPFSDSLGLTNAANRTSGKDLLRSLGVDPGEGFGGDAAGFAAEVATDPLTWLGGAAGRMLGKSADGAAAARGPRYATTAEELERLSIEGGGDPGNPLLQQLLGSKAGSRAASEIPEGSQFLGEGAEAVAFKTPQGDVARISQDYGLPGRPVSEGLLQPTRTADVGGMGQGGFRVERVPLAADVGDRRVWSHRSPVTMTTPTDDVDLLLGRDGLQFTDRHAGNLGTIDGRRLVIDPGAVVPTSRFAGGFAPVTEAADPGRGMSMLLDMLGADNAVRRGGPNFAPRLAAAGAAGGAGAGTAGRYFGG